MDQCPDSLFLGREQEEQIQKARPDRERIQAKSQDEEDRPCRDPKRVGPDALRTVSDQCHRLIDEVEPDTVPEKLEVKPEHPRMWQLEPGKWPKRRQNRRRISEG